MFSGNTFFNQTTLHPLGILAVTILGVAMLALPRRSAVVPVIIMACFIAPAQRIVILTLDFDVMRLMVLFGWMRLLMRGELTAQRWRSLDVVVLAWAVSGTVAMTLLYMSSKALIYRLGIMFDAVGMYFLFRLLIRDWKDIETIAISVAVISLPVALAFVMEKNTGRNVFSIFGGVPTITLMRNGSLRCQGAYAHPILAGAFWASLLPLIIALGFRSDWKRLLAPFGVFCAVLIIVASSSSTPAMAAIVAVSAMCLYPLRARMRLIRWTALFGLLLLQVLMNNPLWHLLTRIDLAGGSTGWYRYKLIDDFIRHINDWWMLGTKSTAVWRQWGSNDITNQYVLEGVTGGLITLTLFVLIILFAFRGVGRFEPLLRSDRARKILAWSIGASLFVHCLVFVGVSYFGQIQMLWYLTLAAIGSLSPASGAARRLAVLAFARTPRLTSAAPASASTLLMSPSVAGRAIRRRPAL